MVSREVLPTRKTGNLLAAIGNSEAKAILLTRMPTRTTLTAVDLYGIMINAQGENPGWITGNVIPFEHCKRSLSPIGLVTYEVLDGQLEAFGYARSEYGETVGLPLAGLLLDLSRRNPHTSLYRLFGGTHTFLTPSENDPTGNNLLRAPESRLQIYQQLLHAPRLPMRLADLESQSGLDAKLLDGHLSQLRRFGLVTYDSTVVVEPFVFHRFSPDAPVEPPTPRARMTTVSNNVYELLMQYPERLWTRDQITQAIIAYTPDRTEEDRNRYYRGIRVNVSKVLTHLRSLGYTEVQRFDNTTRSFIELNETQRALLAETVDIMDRFQAREVQTMARGRILAESLSERDIAQLMKKARLHSPSANVNALDQTQHELILIIGNSPGISTPEIYQELQTRGYSITDAWLRGMLRNMKNDGDLSGQKQGKYIKWSLPS